MKTWHASYYRSSAASGEVGSDRMERMAANTARNGPDARLVQFCEELMSSSSSRAGDDNVGVPTLSSDGCAINFESLGFELSPAGCISSRGGIIRRV